MVLIDSGSTHDFVDPNVIRKKKLQWSDTQNLAVKVVNGDMVKTEGIAAR